MPLKKAHLNPVLCLYVLMTLYIRIFDAQMFNQVFEKNFIETLNPLGKATQIKAELEKVNEALKREAQMLARFRHPALLEVSEAMNDTRISLAFATEPILTNLSNILGDMKNFDVRNITEFKKKHDLDDLEIQKGILQVTKGLEFLHNNHIVHCNLNPSSIYVNAKGDWKIAGFNFAVTLKEGEPRHGNFTYLGGFAPYCSPTLDYLAPECVLDDQCDTYSDIWSLGCLIYAIFNNARSPIECHDNMHSYRDKVERILSVKFDLSNLPTQLHGSPLVEKAQFLKGLVNVLPQFSDKLINRKLLPFLLREMKDLPIVPFLLPSIFKICDKLTPEEFTSKVLPSLKSLFKITDPPQAGMLLLSRFDLLVNKCSSADVFKQGKKSKKFKICNIFTVERIDVMPLLYTALESNTPQLQEQGLKVIPMILEKLDFNSLRTVLLVRLQALYSTPSTLGVKVSTLIAVHALTKTLDKYTITEKVIPMLSENVTREPGVLMAMLAVYEEISKHVDIEVIAREVMPQLWKLCIDPLLNVNQYGKFMKIIHELTAKIEEQHTKQLENLGKLETAAAEKSENIANFTKLVDKKPEIRTSDEWGWSSASPTLKPTTPASNPTPTTNTQTLSGGFASFPPLSASNSVSTFPPIAAPVANVPKVSNNTFQAFSSNASNFSTPVSAFPTVKTSFPTVNQSIANLNTTPSLGTLGAAQPMGAINFGTTAPIYASSAMNPTAYTSSHNFSTLQPTVLSASSSKPTAEKVNQQLLKDFDPFG
ncbi:hypothetical protein HK098_000523 [Nowakowskiella sp. JEL0407]|nr:hypothetical protein HK098_000523 [Nowakowskiella sp. JEL0407]